MNFLTYGLFLSTQAVFTIMVLSQNKVFSANPLKSEMVRGTNYAMYFDLGVYGIPTQVKEKKQFKAVYSMREMEEFTRGVGGAPFLYADTCMTFKEFNEMFDLTLYNRVRKKYKSDEHFPMFSIRPAAVSHLIGRKCCKKKLRSTK